MAPTEISINNTKIYPEYFTRTYGADLPAGTSNVFRLKGIANAKQILKVISMNLDPITAVKVEQIVDQQRRDTMATLQLPGGTSDLEVFDKLHALEFALKEYILSAQNGGAISTDYRATLEYVVDSLDSMTKLNLGVALNKIDEDAIGRLKAQGGPGIDVQEAFDIGIAVPRNYNDFMRLNQIQGTLIDSLPDATTISNTTVRTELINKDVENIGTQEYVLQALFLQKPAQAQVGEATCYISRDDDDDVLTLDPAAIPGSLVRIPLHIHALNNIKVEFDSTTTNQTNYKATAVITKRKIGLGFKAKMLEFLGPGNLPDEIKISSEEEKEIMDKHLLDIARTGFVAIG